MNLENQLSALEGAVSRLSSRKSYNSAVRVCEASRASALIAHLKWRHNPSALPSGLTVLLELHQVALGLLQNLARDYRGSENRKGHLEKMIRNIKNRIRLLEILTSTATSAEKIRLSREHVRRKRSMETSKLVPAL